MKINPGFFANKLFKVLYRPALRDCEIDKTANIGMASNCIRVKMGRYSYMGFYNSVCDTTIGPGFLRREKQYEKELLENSGREEPGG